MKEPKNDSKYQWTMHVFQKMRYYGISESLIKRIVRFPKRTESGIAPDTVAVMQPTANKKKPQEIWVMYQSKMHKEKTELAGVSGPIDRLGTLSQKKIIISAWRYPGVTPIDKSLHIPSEVLDDLANYEEAI